MKRTAFIYVIILSLFTVLFAGCTNAANQQIEVKDNGGISGGTGKEQTDAGGGSAGTKPEPVELTYWMHQNDAFDNANKKLIADFEKQNPNIKVKVEIFPYDDYVQKIRTAYAGNQAPDVAQVFGTWVTPLAKSGLLKMVVNGKDYLSRMFPASTGAYTVDGKLYGIPREFNLGNGGILAHPEMFKKAGIEYPKTWSELIDGGKKLTILDSNGNIKVKGFDFASGDSIMFLMLSMILQQGGDFWTKDQMINFSTPEAVKAFTTMRDMVTQYKLTDLKNLNGQLNTFDYFYKGESAMDFDGPWVVPLGKETYNTEDFDYIPMPSFTDKPPFFAAESGWGEIISAKTKHPKEAEAFVEFITSKENNIYWNTQTGTIPAEIEIARDPKYIEANKKIKPSFDVLQYGKWIGPVENRDFFNKQLTDGFQKVVDGAPVDVTLKTMEQEINKMIKKERK